MRKDQEEFDESVVASMDEGQFPDKWESQTPLQTKGKNIKTFYKFVLIDKHTKLCVKAYVYVGSYLIGMINKISLNFKEIWGDFFEAFLNFLIFDKYCCTK